MFSGLKLKMEIKTTKKQLMSFRIDYEKLLEKYKTIWPQTEDLKNNVFLVCYDRSIKTKKRTYSDKAYINFYGLNAPENYIECKSFTVVSILSLHTKINITRNYLYTIRLIKMQASKCWVSS